MLGSVFDPLGFIAPVIFTARTLLQNLCRQKLGWDEPISEDTAVAWRAWLDDLKNIFNVRIPRCFSPSIPYDNLVKRELHFFADASSKGYGVVSYLRVVNPDHAISCKFVLSKSRLAPMKSVSIPRLELVTAKQLLQLRLMLHWSVS